MIKIKESVKKSLLIEILIGLIAILNFIVPSIFSNNKYIIFLIAIIGLVALLLGINLKRNANDKIIIKNVLIYLFAYYLIIYLFGLYIGFARTIYNYSWVNLYANILPTLLSIICVEFIRYTLISKTNNDKLISISSCIVIILLECSLNFYAYNFSVSDNIYQYIGLVFLASISKNILMTVLYQKTDVLPGIIYRLIMEELIYVVIIVPNFGPYIQSVALIILPILIAFMIINLDRKKVKEKPKDRKKINKLYLIITGILLILVLLNSGLLKYQLLVVGSNSMKEFMEKGDVILVEKLKGDEKDTVLEGEILVFRYDNKIISHRVSRKIERSEKIYYKTKGDNNSQEDNTVVANESIIGKVVLRIRYVGLPSIWLNELFN